MNDPWLNWFETLFGTLAAKLVTCFSLSTACSFFTQLREPNLPPLRVLIATAIYTGFSGVAIALMWINYYGLQNTTFLLLTSLAAGLGTTNMLTAIWTKAMPSLVNYIWRKATGENLIDTDTFCNPPAPAERSQGTVPPFTSLTAELPPVSENRDGPNPNS